ncbi:hypothetical protein FCL47_21155 [Desulfopila sp. IMCC35006]|uniref:cupredoxin domain-containing protein n=1 Tax=Desulfopila sp. IMCC35006 TaxID=2569542 RepID=UPI0010AC81EF|nr:cupredoxin family protein [Desulfopila sp. IMCC35006]TKB23702.1 hypothetical protein FCL47_21155 [Desulfopila sp. IMCC35006]
MKIKTIQFLFYLVIPIALAGVAFASGNHSGGHEQGHDAKAIGEPGMPAMVDRTVHIDMNDEMRYVPDHLIVKQGETIKFVLKNSGEIDHEFVLGTEKELLEHYKLMQKFPEMEHEDPNQVRVAPGQVGEVVWHFTKPGKIDFGCLMPGHYDAGMKGTVEVGSAALGSDGKKAPSDSHKGHQHGSPKI